MAVVSAWYSFDQRNLNLNSITANSEDGWFTATDVNYTWNGQTYEDALYANWNLGSNNYSSAFLGYGLKVIGAALTKGTITAFLNTEDFDGTGDAIWGISDISVSATAIFDTVLTKSTKDEYKIFNKLLAGNDKFFLSDEADFAKGLGGKDKMYGYGGDDNLSGGNGNDKLFGGTDADNLKGGTGNDKLFGEEGNDILKGQGGADRFVFRAGYEQDTVKDFSDKDDVLDLRSFGLSSVAEAKSYATMIDGDTVFDFGGGDLLILEDFNMSALDKGDFII